jgi:hypothetical protein
MCQSHHSADYSGLSTRISTMPKQKLSHLIKFESYNKYRVYPPTRNQSKITKRMLVSSLDGRDQADSTYHDLQDPPQPTRCQIIYPSISSTTRMMLMMSSNSQGSPFQSQSTHLPCILNLKCHFLDKLPQSSKYLIFTL